MARATYIYLVHNNVTKEFLGGFTVKWEAHEWVANRCTVPRDQLELSRCRDGYRQEDKSRTVIPWDFE